MKHIKQYKIFEYSHHSTNEAIKSDIENDIRDMTLDLTDIGFEVLIEPSKIHIRESGFLYVGISWPGEMSVFTWDKVKDVVIRIYNYCVSIFGSNNITISADGIYLKGKKGYCRLDFDDIFEESDLHNIKDSKLYTRIAMNVRIV